MLKSNFFKVATQASPWLAGLAGLTGLAGLAGNNRVATSIPVGLLAVLRSMPVLKFQHFESCQEVKNAKKLHLETSPKFGQYQNVTF